jgi:hypothetical protein
MPKKTAKAVKVRATAPQTPTLAASPTPMAQPVQPPVTAVPPGNPEVFGSPANRPVNQTLGGVKQMPFPKR